MVRAGAGRPDADLQARAAGVALWPAVLSSSCPLQEAELDREEAPSPPFSLAAPCKGSQLWPCDSVCKQTVSSRSRNPGKCLSLLCPHSSDCLSTSSASGPGRWPFLGAGRAVFGFPALQPLSQAPSLFCFSQFFPDYPGCQ